MHRSDEESAKPDSRRRGVSRTTGFPSPAEDATDLPLNLHALVVRRPAATFFLRMSGDAMRGAGIHDGDVVIVDRSLRPVPGSVIVAAVDGTLLVRRYRVAASAAPARPRVTGYLVAEHPDVAPIRVTEAGEVLVWGVVTFVVHRVEAKLEGLLEVLDDTCA